VSDDDDPRIVFIPPDLKPTSYSSVDPGLVEDSGKFLHQFEEADFYLSGGDFAGVGPGSGVCSD
jgi:hypothetical protein